MRKIVSILLLTLLVSTPIYARPSRTLDMYQISTDVSMYLKGEKIGCVDFIENGRSYVSLRNLGNQLGINFDWDQVNKKVLFQDKGKEISLKIDSTRARVGNKQITISAPPRIRYGYTHLPLRAVTELLDMDINLKDLKIEEQQAKEMLFEIYPGWKERELAGRISMGGPRYSVYVFEADSYDPSTETFNFHAYESISNVGGDGHTATLGWYEIKVDRGVIVDVMTGERLR